MSPIFSVFKPLLRRVSVLLVLVSLLNLAIGFLPIIPSSYADVSSPAEAIQEIREDLAEQDPQKIYKEATEPSGDPKREAEEKYNENLQEYYKENPGKGGIIEGAKGLIDKVTPDIK